MVTLQKKNVTLFALSLVLPLVQFLVQVDSFYLSDPLVKMIQVISLWKQQWQTQSIVYPAYEFDPLFLLSPFNEGFVFQNQERLIGNYPIAFTFIYSLFGFIPFQFLPFLNFLFLLGFLKLLNNNSIKTSVLIFVTFGTVVFPLLIDFSENAIFLLLSGYGYIFLLKAFQNQNTKHWFLGNFFLGLAIWFRLEAVLFFASIQVTIFIIDFFIEKKSLVQTLNPIRYIIFLLILSSFLLWNQYSYSHPMGTRYLATMAYSSRSIWDQIMIFLSMSLTFPKPEGWSLGFFLQSPIFLFALIQLRKEQLQRNQTLFYHFCISMIFLLIVGITSPNDGITLTGRYLLLLVYPLSFILNEQIENIQKKKTIFYILSIWTSICALVISAIFFFANKELTKLKKEIKPMNSELIVTTSELLSGAYGLDLIEKKVLCIKNPYLVKYLFYNIEKKSLNEFLITTVEKQTKYNQYEKGIYDSIISESSLHGYRCMDEEHSKRILSRRCLKTN
ncbi:dolichyl-phosphate-mannose-protein mannosyltransferase [Leptospira bourretii]|uniref:Dolichyl-phosphate-mannose-protein mannosyltransferase n=2 Tax=Leptospira bourretii TaxID=2484962 RepID=A0A4R9II24_9LEPT|nr:dolichyl-phosphate-mannose-protein mannosyltransferase [Leptospira bourretii]TGK88150.1 dolichyl-phosphate-mannose-protein mannosyltransferase [Leptospira bourretii]TGK88800.1 dolichyl-phosphate-mannose-protein mannosyltransferase [Leptospira bourretii]